MKIQVDVNTTKQDYYDFQKHHTLRYIWIYILLAVLTGLLAAVNIRIYKNTGVLNYLTVFINIIALIMLVYMVVTSILKIKNTAKAEEKKPVFVYIFTKGGVHCASNGKSFDLTWDKIYKVTEVKEMFLVYLNQESALIVPKRFFTSEADVEEFRKELLFKPRKRSKIVKNKGIL